MCNYARNKRSGIVLRRYANDIAKELFRKVIHLCAAFIPFFLSSSAAASPAGPPPIIKQLTCSIFIV